MKSKNPRMPNAADKHVGQKLRVIRQNKNLTQRDLAKMVNITFQQIQKYEKGINRISIGTLYDICSALEIPPIDFLKDFYKEYKVAEKTVSPVATKVIGLVNTLPENAQKNVLKYVKNLVKNNKAEEEK